MNILFLTQILPYPLDAGPKIRIYYVLRYLAQYHRVTLIAFTRGATDERNAEQLRSFLHAVHTVPIQRSRIRDGFFLAQSVLTDQPFLIVRDQVAAMHATIQRVMHDEHFDAVHADQLGMAQYAVGLNGVTQVLDQHNAVWTIVQRMWQNERQGPRKWVMAREWRTLQRYEARTCQQFDHIVTVTEEDARALQSLDPTFPLPITVMPICIDPAALPRVAVAERPRNIIFLGGMFYPPNVDGALWFARNVFPLVQAANPESQFFIVGARPDHQIVELGAAEPQIRVTGYVADATPYLSESAVFIVPLRAGGGMRVKILDAWLRGIPIVSTTIGCEGIETRPGENLLIADSPADFAAAVSQVIQNPALGKQLANNGRRWVEEKYSWQTVYQKLDSIYAREKPRGELERAAAHSL